MSKRLLFALLSSTLPLAFTPVSALNAPTMTKVNDYISDVCSAPPPNNFRITSIGGTFMSLAWQPTWDGAIHSLEVSKKDFSGEWVTQYTLENVPDSTLTVYNLEPGTEWRFRIATKCVDGESSALSDFKDGIALILELTTEGRRPLNPTVIDCNNISLKHAWIGFRIEYLQQGISIANLFEFTHDGSFADSDPFSKLRIKRVNLTHPIVAVNPDGIWPTFFNPILPNVPIPFRIDRLIGDGSGSDRDNIGFVNLIQNTNPLSVDLCPDYSNTQQPWKSNYTFTPLVAEQVMEALLPEINKRSEISSTSNCDVKAQSPFEETLNVFLSQSNFTEKTATFCLLNTNGQTLMEQHLEITGTQVSFPLAWLPSGVYILSVKSGDEIRSLKVIKSK